MNPVRVGVFGAGKLGGLHIQKLLQIKECHLVGFYDPNHQRCRELEQLHSLKAFKEPQELLENVDAGFITASTTHHESLLESALRLKRHVFVEKPITESFATSELITQRFLNIPMMFQVGFLEGFKLRDLCRQFIDRHPEINLRPRRVEIERLNTFSPRGTDADVFYDVMIHDLELLAHWVDNNDHWTITHIEKKRVQSALPDSAEVKLAFSSELQCQIKASRVAHDVSRLFKVDLENTKLVFDFKINKLTAYLNGTEETYTPSFSDAILEEDSHFIQSIVSPLPEIKLQLCKQSSFAHKMAHQLSTAN